MSYANVEDLLHNKDVLFYLFYYALYQVFDGNFSLALIAINGTTLYMVVYAIESWGNRVSLPFGLFVYYSYFALIAEDQMRQMFALSFFLLAIRFAFTKEPLKYFALILIGGMCHITILLGLPIYWLARKVSLKNEVFVLVVILLSLSACLMSKAAFSILGNLFESSLYFYYFEEMSISQTAEAIGTGFGFLIYLAPCIFPLVFYSNYLSQKEFGFFFFLMALAAPLKMLSYESVFLGRLYLVPAIGMVLMYPMIYRSIADKKKRVAFLAISCLLLLLFYTYSFSTTHGVAAYSFITE